MATPRQPRRASVLLCGTLLGLVLSSGSLSVHAGPIYMVTDLGINSLPDGINNSGQVVGVSGGVATLFSGTGSGNTSLGSLGGAGSRASGIGNNGQAFGYATTGSGQNHATLFSGTGSGNTDLGTLGGTASYATGFGSTGGSTGKAVGWATTSGNAAMRATLFSGTGIDNTDLGTLGGNNSNATSVNDTGQVVGAANIAGDLFSHATLFDSTGNGANIDLGTLGGNSSFGTSINNSGQVVGVAYKANGLLRATMFDITGNGANIDMGTLGGNNSYAQDINNSGQVVGFSENANFRNDAFIWASGLMTALDTLIDPLAGFDLTDARGINDLGQIAAYGIDNQGRGHALLLTLAPAAATSVPEPGSLALIGVALLGLALARKRNAIGLVYPATLTTKPDTACFSEANAAGFMDSLVPRTIAPVAVAGFA